MSQAPEQYRIRITFGKHGSLRFIGHLDLARTWERVLRRAEMPLRYSQGFNPQPKIQLASALPLGITSECELLDIWLDKWFFLGNLPEKLNAVSPSGLVTYAVEEIDLKSPALQSVLAGADYLVTVDEVDDDTLRQRIAALLAESMIEHERKGKTYNLRPRILDLQPQGEGVFLAKLSLGQRGTARPDEVVDAMGLSPHSARYHRIKIHLTLDQAQSEA